MAGKFSLADHIQKAQPLQVRDIETITEEIITAKLQIGENLFVIGRGLIEAKAQLPHGEWLPWLTMRVEFSEATAQNYMKLVRKYSNPEALRDLGYTKALMLLSLPDGTREKYIETTHIVNGEEKTVAEMSSRELKAVLKERDDALRTAAQAQADQKEAEAGRDKLSQEIALANDRIAGLSAEVKQRSAEVSEARDAAARLEQELAELRSRPRDVAVEVDTAAVEAARKAAEDAKTKAQQELEQAKADAKAALEKAVAEGQAIRERAEKAEKRAAMAGNEDMALFRTLFDQAQETINKMSGVLLKFRSKNPPVAENLSKALLALSEKVREAAEG